MRYWGWNQFLTAYINCEKFSSVNCNTLTQNWALPGYCAMCNWSSKLGLKKRGTRWELQLLWGFHRQTYEPRSQRCPSETWCDCHSFLCNMCWVKAKDDNTNQCKSITQSPTHILKTWKSKLGRWNFMTRSRRWGGLLLWHTKVRRWSGWSLDHRSHTEEEDAQLYDWCNKLLNEDGPNLTSKPHGPLLLSSTLAVATKLQVLTNNKVMMQQVSATNKLPPSTTLLILMDQLRKLVQEAMRVWNLTSNFERTWGVWIIWQLLCWISIEPKGYPWKLQRTLSHNIKNKKHCNVAITDHPTNIKILFAKICGFHPQNILGSFANLFFVINWRTLPKSNRGGSSTWKGNRGWYPTIYSMELTLN